jgi:hypothetical protein
MPKNTNQPQPAVLNTPEKIVQAVNDAASRKSKNLFAMAQAGISEKARLKSALLGEVRQKLAEIADTATDADHMSKEAEENASQQAFRLYQARVTGTINADELSGLLGDIFGYKPTAKGTPGRTPAGLGEAIRKRVVRGVAATEFVEGRDGGAFFDPLEKEDVSDVLHQLNNGQMTVWQVYKKLADMKSEATNRPHMAFDPRRIAAIVDKLNEEGARKIIHSNTALVIAYGKLIETLNVLGEVPEEEATDAVEEIAEELTEAGPNPVSQAA